MNIAVYQDEGIELEIRLDESQQTIWLTQEQIAQLFDKDRDTIGKHIRNIYNEGELDRQATTAIFAVVREEGGRSVSREIAHYNLDMMISVGYRVNSLRATRFRQWATRILKAYIVNGYVFNENRLQSEELLKKLDEIEGRLADHDEKFELVFESLRQILVPPEQPTRRIGFRIKDGKG